MTSPTATVAIRRRTSELGLLALVGLVVVAAYVLAGFGQSASIPSDVIPFLGIVLGLFIGAHVAVRTLAPGADPVLVPVAALLNGLGYVFIARLDKDLAAQQAAWTAVGLVGFVVVLAAVRRVRIFERYRYSIGLVALVLVVLPLVPGIGRSINGARIWTKIGPVSFQPGEFAKLALAVFFAAYIVERRELLTTSTTRLGPVSIPDLRHLGPLLMTWGVSLVVMVFERDLGSALLFFLLFLVVLWVATGRLAYVAIGTGLFAMGGVGAYLSFSHVADRVDIWLDPWADPLDTGYQVIQATYALAWGGVAGTGLGQGINGRIPYEETDFIFAIVGEELGLVGATALLVSYLLLVGVGLRVAVTATDPFAKLLSTGLTALMAIQSFVIMAGVTRLLPLTGVTLPFLSYGGSSLVSNWILIALLVRVSDETAQAATGDNEPTIVIRR